MATTAVSDERALRAGDSGLPSHAGPPLRVAICLDGMGVGGTELNTVRTLERLPAERFDVTLVSLSGDGPLRERFERAGVRIASFPLGGLFTRSSLRQVMRLRALLRERDVEIVHSQDMYSNVFATAAARAAGTPVVITSRRWHAFERPAFRVANAAAFHFSSCVVANSPLVAALTHRDERVPTRRLEVVPNFVDDAAFDAPGAAERERFRAEVGVPQGALVVGVVANLWKEKDQATLVRALARLGTRAPEVHVVLVGEGPMRATLVELAESLGVADRLHLAGRRPQLPNSHHHFDVSALTSITEGFPNSLLEAMAAARPIVATDVGGVRDAVGEGVTGYVVAARDVDALAERLAELLGDAALRARMGAAGRARAIERHSPAVAIDTLERLYRSLLARAGARPRPVEAR